MDVIKQIADYIFAGLFVCLLLPPVVGVFIGSLSGFYDDWVARRIFDFLAE